ncbi:BTAD domain-containing putative transcriptional regulator [Kutzneria viridogrisea]|uniref:OmpR/PhoB-type domain-containing protein n=2 Tax=Kutzneria TaxID=43356 RepID=W5VZL4_9PSEU|nr:BTAD domain-containing putative transcriptional regulator [Kutzneria albida]AHH93930.1 hypothetical protein KALB_554 [Kutzneria albida DSM 43870]MBA8931065.1 DNA-binding SARP family transcriptional activator [Kutzneria viridogrisea]
MTAYFGVLGSLEVVVDGRVVEVPAAKHRVLLAVLLLNANQVVEPGELVHHLWGEDPPAGARNTLRTYVMRLRRLLGPEVGVRTAPSGYAVDVPEDGLDLHRFRELVERARSAQDALAWDLLTEALALWRGPMLADVALNSPAVEAVAEEHLLAVELRAAAGLALGRHSELVDWLRELTAEHPSRERLWAHLMRALDGAGRRAEAIRAYQTVATHLADQLGIDPGVELQQLHERFTAVVVPAQLPSNVIDFVGRRELTDRIVTELGVRTVVLTGPPGVGKTALAVHAAHLARAHFPDGQLFVDLRGYSTEAAQSTEQVLSRFLRALGMPDSEVPVGLGPLTHSYTSLVADRRLLVVLDNAADPEQVARLLPTAPGCAALVTSRDHMPELAAPNGSLALEVAELAPDESRELLARMVGPVDEGEIDELASRCAHLPLALRIAGANVATMAYPDMASYLTLLRDEDSLSALAVEGDEQFAVRTAFDLSYQAQKPADQRLFRLLGLLPGADFTAAVANVLTGDTDAVGGLRRLWAGHLVAEPEPGRYQLHDLLRSYAHDRSYTDEQGAEREAALSRVHEHYRTVVAAAALVISPESTSLLPEPMDLPAPFDSRPAALDWIGAELANLVALVRHCCEHGRTRIACRIVDDLRGFFYARPLVAEWELITRTALAAAAREPDVLLRAAMRYNLGALHWSTAHYREAVEQYKSSLAVYSTRQWPDAERAALINLAIALWELGRLRECQPHFERALELARQHGSPIMRASVMLNLGNVHLTLAQTGPAFELLTEARGICAELGVYHGELACMRSLLYLAREMGEYGRAQQYIEWVVARDQEDALDDRHIWDDVAKVWFDLGRRDEAIAIARRRLAEDTGGSHAKDDVDLLVHLADMYVEVGRAAEALELHEKALAASTEHDSRDTWVSCLTGVARDHLDLGAPELALHEAQRAVVVAEEFDLGLRLGRAKLVAAQARLALGQHAAALDMATQALHWHESHSLRIWSARTLCVLAEVHRASGEQENARSCWNQALALFEELGVPQGGEVQGSLGGCR